MIDEGLIISTSRRIFIDSKGKIIELPLHDLGLELHTVEQGEKTQFLKESRLHLLIREILQIAVLIEHRRLTENQVNYLDLRAELVTFDIDEHMRSLEARAKRH